MDNIVVILLIAGLSGILGYCEGTKEERKRWRDKLKELKEQDNG